LAQLPKFRKSTNLQQRILSAAVLLPLSLYLIYLGPPISLIFGGLVCLFVIVEWFSLSFKIRKNLGLKVIYFLLGTTYIAIAIIWFFSYFFLSDGWKVIYWLLFLVWSTDILAYIGGVALKGPKLIPSISPKKTWSGFLAGMVGGTATAHMLSFWLVPGAFTLFSIIILVLIAQLGDLLESIFKRMAGLKDSSPFIPGHGGFLDRLDSLLAVCFALALWQTIHI
jgi:CDP-diglyceride synthetase